MRTLAIIAPNYVVESTPHARFGVSEITMDTAEYIEAYMLIMDRLRYVKTQVRREGFKGAVNSKTAYARQGTLAVRPGGATQEPALQMHRSILGLGLGILLTSWLVVSSHGRWLRQLLCISTCDIRLIRASLEIALDYSSGNGKVSAYHRRIPELAWLNTFAGGTRARCKYLSSAFVSDCHVLQGWPFRSSCGNGEDEHGVARRGKQS